MGLKLRKLFKSKRTIAFLIVAFFVLLLVLAPHFSLAGDTDTGDSDSDDVQKASTLGKVMAMIVSFIARIFVWLLGPLVLMLVEVLMQIAVFNKFIQSSAVSNGWVVVRDLCNMFFVLILLIIAFATILKIENYNYKKLLPKVLILAVLVNFSKAICGVAIDFAQVVMLTFVNGFKAIGPGNILNATGLPGVLSFSDFSDEDQMGSQLTATSAAASYVLAVVYLIIIAIVLVVLIVVLAFRIVMLWLLIILSPLFFLLLSFPGGATYARQWSSQFVKYLVVGPILAFFLWLSFSVFGTIGQDLGTSGGGGGVQVGITQAGTWSHAYQFIVAIALLIGGLTITSQLGVAGGSLAGKAVQKMQAIGTGIATGAVKLPFKAAGKAVSWGERELYAGTGIGLSPVRWRKKWKDYAERRIAYKEAAGTVKAADKSQEMMARPVKEGRLRGLRAGAKAGVGMFYKTIGDTENAAEDYAGPRGIWRGVKTIFKPGDVEKLSQEVEEKKKERVKAVALSKASRIDKAIMGRQVLKDKVIEDRAKEIGEERIANPDSEYNKNIESDLKSAAKKEGFDDEGQKKWAEFQDKEEDMPEGKKEFLEARDREFANQEVNEGEKFASFREALEDMSFEDLEAVANQDIDQKIEQNKQETKKLEHISDPRHRTDDALRLKRLTDIKNELAALRRKREETGGRETNEEREKREKHELELQDLVKFDKLKERGEILEAQRAGPEAGKKYQEKADKLKEEIDVRERKIRDTVPTTYYAERQRRMVEAEELKKYPTESMEATELVDLAKKAIDNKDRIGFSAIMKKLTQDYNDNEIFNALGYRGDRDGAEQFRKDIMVGKLGMGQQESMAVMNEVNFMNEKTGHWNVTRMYKHQNGMYEYRGAENASVVAAHEMLKGDSRQNLLRLNRLAYGSEKEGEPYELDISGQLYLTNPAVQKAFLYRATRDEINPTVMANLYAAIGQLRRLVEMGMLSPRVTSIIESKMAAGKREEEDELGSLIDNLRLSAKEIVG